MAQTRLVSLAKRLCALLEKHLERKPARRIDALRQLLALLASARVPEGLRELAASGRVRGASSLLHALENHLARSSCLPEALCCRYQYRQPESRARAGWRVRESEWRFFHELAREARAPLDLLYEHIDLTGSPWHDPIEESAVSVDVLLDPSALDDLLLCAIEGLLSPKKGMRKGYEVYGVAVGMVKERTDARRGSGFSVNRHVYVMRCQPQLSAYSTFKSVEWQEGSIQALLTASRSLFPHYAAVADFHSHPYDHFEEMIERRGWAPSEGDEESNVEWFQDMQRLGERPEVSLVVGIAPSRARFARGHFRQMEHTLQVPVGHCRAVVGAYRILGSGHYTTRNLRLLLPGMLA